MELPDEGGIGRNGAENPGDLTRGDTHEGSGAVVEGAADKPFC